MPAVHPIALTAPGINKKELTSGIKLSVHWVSGERHPDCERDSLQESELHSDMDSSGLGTFFVGLEVANIIDEVTIWEHFRILCAKVGAECTKHLDRAQAATHTRDWRDFGEEWTSCGDLIVRSGHTGDSVSDYKVTTLKEQCKEFVTNTSESVIWEVQKSYFNYFKTEVCLRWTREGSKLYQGKYPDKLDYVSKLNEALVLCVSAAFAKASEVLEEIIYNLDSKPWIAKATDAHPAARYCNPLYEYLTHRLLCHCYQQMAVLSGRGKKKTNKWIELVNKETAECRSLLAQSGLAKMFSFDCHRVSKALEYAAKNKREEGYEKSSWDECKWVDFPLSATLNEFHTVLRSEYRQSYESGTPVERYFLTAEACSTEVLNNWDSLGPVDRTQIHTLMDLVRLHHEKDRQVMFLKQSSKSDVEEKAPILRYGESAIECYVKGLLQHTKHDDYWILSDVPFAALRKLDSPVGQGYLIQSHTISVTPSLRVLQDCDHKWKELDQNTNPGTIVAVAEPYFYENKGNGTKVPLITPMGEEVNFIEEEFGEGYVTKLVGRAATPSEVLKWAKYPSEHPVKQVVFHIAAHGIRQDDFLEVKKGAIILARNDTAGQRGTRAAKKRALL
ncbi:unnamed protein product, partial [Sphagnum compactum]